MVPGAAFFLLRTGRALGRGAFLAGISFNVDSTSTFFLFPTFLVDVDMSPAPSGVVLALGSTDIDFDFDFAFAFSWLLLLFMPRTSRVRFL